MRGQEQLKVALPFLLETRALPCRWFERGSLRCLALFRAGVVETTVSSLDAGLSHFADRLGLWSLGGFQERAEVGALFDEWYIGRLFRRLESLPGCLLVLETEAAPKLGPKHRIVRRLRPSFYMHGGLIDLVS